MQDNSDVTPVGVRSAAFGGFSAVSYVEWGAVWAGAAAALAVSFVLLTFGAAVGLAAVSPWSLTSTSVTAVGVGSAFWILLVSLWSFALGGYLSARLRHQWSDGVMEEVEFRDKAHGLVSWATAVTVAAVIATAVASPGSRSGGFGDSPVTATAVDKIVRTTKAGVPAADVALRREVARALASNLSSNALTAADRAFLIGVVEARGGAPAPEAATRVTQAFSELKTATDRIRKAGVVMGFLVAATLMVGAAVAWWAAGVGGEHRAQGTRWHAFARGPARPFIRAN